MGKDTRTAARGIVAPKLKNKTTRKSRRVVGDEAVVAKERTLAQKYEELQRMWPLVLTFTSLQRGSVMCNVVPDYIQMELRFSNTRYEVSLPFEGLTAYEHNRDKIEEVWSHWLRLQEWHSLEVGRQKRANRKAELLAGMSDEDKDILGLDE